jgi:dephospho-CoA kinase
MASGKGEVVKLLEEKGYHYISLSDFVREEARREGKPVNREHMQNIGNRLRQTGGAGVLGRMVKDRILASDIFRWVIDGIRNPAEVQELKQMEGFRLLGVEADITVILQRMKERNRDTDRMSEEDLRKRLDREWGIGEPENGQQVGPCMKLADFKILNNSSLDELSRHIEKILNDLERQQ